MITELLMPYVLFPEMKVMSTVSTEVANEAKAELSFRARNGHVATSAGYRLVRAVFKGWRYAKRRRVNSWSRKPRGDDRVILWIPA